MAACKAPDGSYWALQRWQRLLPMRGIAPFRPGAGGVRAPHLALGGELARLEVSPNWTSRRTRRGSSAGSPTAGRPVYGFRTPPSGNPTDGYARFFYVDTFNSAYGAGWKHETSIVFRNPQRRLLLQLLPHEDVSLPGRPLRPPGHGSAIGSP